MFRLALCAAMLCAAPALAQVAPAPAEAPKPAAVTVRLDTSDGPILLELEKERAPITTANFLRYVDAKRFDGMEFYRAMRLGPDSGLIQGGIQGDGTRAFPPIAHEPTSKTGILHTDGTISLARFAPGTARADFFITIGPIPFLDAHPDQPGDNAGFAAFGHVVEGMDVVRRILAAPISATKGEGPMRGQMIAAPIRILTARRVVAPKP